LNLSIIIPTFNEAQTIVKCLNNIQSQRFPCEVIVADGGSSDGTLDLVEDPVQIVTALKGRASQMNAGVARATGDVLLFLHADTILPPGGLACLHDSMANGGAPGGAFRLAFEPSSPILEFFAWWTRFSFRMLHYGDAGIFVRRDVFDRLGGYADLALMEDLDLWLKLMRRGKPLVLPLAATTSSRRYLRRGVIRQQALNFGLTLLWLMGANDRKLADWYYGRKVR
jgi:rSAM/selenodomain-associated transferase 2